MKIHKLSAGGRKIADVYCFLDHQNQDAVELFKNVAGDVPKLSDIGYMGFRSKPEMEKHLYWAMFGSKYSKKLPVIRRAIEDESLRIVQSVLAKCRSLVVPKESVRVFLFPTFDMFVKIKMCGSTGYCPIKSAITLYIYPTASKSEWKKSLSHSTCHEYAHDVTHSYHTWKTLLDGLVFEGLAACFTESVLKIKPAWSVAVNEKKSRLVFSKIKKSLNSRNGSLYKEVFYAGRKYPMYAGYSIGYYIVKGYLKNAKNKKWQDVFKRTPEEILKVSKFAE